MSGFDFRTIMRAGDVVAWPQGPGEPAGLSGALVARAMTCRPSHCCSASARHGRFAANMPTGSRCVR